MPHHLTISNSDLLDLDIDDEEEEASHLFPDQQSRPPKSELYDGKRLPPAQPAERQQLPDVPVCMKEMSHYWSSPFNSKLPTKGYSILEIQGMGELGSDPQQ